MTPTHAVCPQCAGPTLGMGTVTDTPCRRWCACGWGRTTWRPTDPERTLQQDSAFSWRTPLAPERLELGRQIMALETLIAEHECEPLRDGTPGIWTCPNCQTQWSIRHDGTRNVAANRLPGGPVDQLHNLYRKAEQLPKLSGSHRQ